MLEIVCIPLIVVIVYFIMLLYKKFIAKGNESLIRIIPLIACICGVVAGIICYFGFPSFIAAANLSSAMLIGGASGLSATGCNQIFKQLSKYGIDIKEVEVKGITKKDGDDANDKSN